MSRAFEGWSLGFEPAADASEGQDYFPMFSKSEQIGDTTHIVLVDAERLVKSPPSEWHEILAQEWAAAVKGGG